MKRSTILFIALFVFSATAFSQDVEYGKPDELKGLTRLYIDCGTDVESCNIFIAEIEKAKLSGLEIVDEAANAQIMLVYEASKEDKFYKGSSLRRSTGKGYVAIQGKNPNRPRLLMSFENIKDTALEDKPAKKFAKEFIKNYREANGLKK